jgi:DNA replication factor GINS
MPDNPDKPRINLHNILREERKSKLVPLENDFYEKVAAQIRELQDEKTRIEDIYGTKYAIIDDELKTARKSIENIIERRIGKIIKEASLRASSRQKEKQDIESMTQEERRFYNRLLELNTEIRRELLDKISRKENQAAGSQAAATREIHEYETQKATPIETPIETQPETQIETLLEDKKDISKEYIVVRLLKDIPTFVGVDGRNYTLAKEDIAVLSTVNAKALINRKAAIQITVKR